MAGDLSGRLAIVTGGAGLVGAAICRRFSAAGATVAIFDFDEDKAPALAVELGGRAKAYSGDVLVDQWLRSTV